jgi:hypothetical protein
VSISDFGSTTSGLFGIGGPSNNLYSIDSTTGAATLIGPSGATGTGYNTLSNNGNSLYLSLGESLYSLNTSTGAATLVGTMSSNAGAGMLAMLFEDGFLYGGQGTQIDTINPSNAGQDFLGTFSFLEITNRVDGLSVVATLATYGPPPHRVRKISKVE